jgi:hypothetical protein
MTGGLFGLVPHRKLMEIVGFSPTSESDGGGAQHIGGGHSHRLG